MGNLNGFDATQVEPSAAYELIPTGWAKMMITESEMKATKAGTGEYLSLRFDIIEGEHQGRILFANLNLNNPNQTAVEIAQRDLSGICHAIGVLNPNDSTDLHDIPMMGKIGIQPAKNGYEASNKIVQFEPCDGAKPAPTNTPQGGSEAEKKPWE